MAAKALALKRRRRARKIAWGGAKRSPRKVNPIKKLETFFLSFDSGARLEIMRKPDLARGPNNNQTSGWTHVALVVGTTEAVDRKAASLQKKVG